MRTRDGIRVGQIERVARSLGIGTRTGTRHATMLTYPRMRPCPVADSTNARTMVIPWMREAIGYRFTNNEIYSAIKNGSYLE